MDPNYSTGASGYTADSEEVKQEIAKYPGLSVDAAIGNLEMRKPTPASPTPQTETPQYSTTDQTSQTSQTGQTMNDIYGNLVYESPEQKAYRLELERQGEASKLASQGTFSEDEIRANVTSKFQAEIDAMNRLYAEKRRIAEEQIKGREGSNTAIQGRRGMIGSTMGVTQKDKLATLGKQEIGAIEAERSAAISAIMMEIENKAAAQLAEKTAAAKQGATEYLSYLQNAAKTKAEQIQEVARRAALTGELSDNEMTQMAQALGIDLQQFKQIYKEQQLANTPTAGKPLTEKIGDQLYQYDSQTGAWTKVAGEQGMSELELYQAKKAIDAQYAKGELSELELYQAKAAIDNQYKTEQLNLTNTQKEKETISVGDLKQAEFDAYNYYSRMNQSNQTINSTEGVGADKWGYIQGNKWFPNVLQSSERQQMEQAQRDFVNAILRRESGAAIADSEFESASKQYFPQPGDSVETIAQKRANRETSIKNIGFQAQRAIDVFEGNQTDQKTETSLKTIYESDPNNAKIIDTLYENPKYENYTENEMVELYNAIKGISFNNVGGDTESATKVAAITSKIPAGTKYSSGYDGECGYWSRKIVDYPSGTGDTLSAKKAYLAKNGIDRNTWQSQGVKVGDVIITDESKQYGHVVVVNSINPDGTVTVSESNFRGPYVVSHDRKIPITSSRIQGVVRGKLKNLA